MQRPVRWERAKGCILAVLGIALCAPVLSACVTSGGVGVGDLVPHWAGGLPADAPPRPGTAKYDEWMAERERQRQTPVAEGAKDGQVAPAAANATTAVGTH
ncbi:MAG: hypothetical protein FWD68_09870 [Alphaproteobacteria bacterium]|nr:hypothetical protein [Alphaproteobacteria bacterium]